MLWRRHLELLLDIVNVEKFGELGLDVRGDLRHVFFTVDTATFTTFGGLHGKGVKPETLRVVGIVDDFSVGMEAEHIGVREDWDGFDVLQVLLMGLKTRHGVIVTGSGEEELLVGIENEIPAELLEITVHYASVVVVRNTTTVHGFTNQVSQRLPWQLVITIFHRLVHVQGNQSE